MATQGGYFRARLSRDEVRGAGVGAHHGLAIGVEFGEESHYASQLGDRCREAGLLVSAEEDNLLTMFPALTIEREVVRRGTGYPGTMFVSGRRLT